MKETDAELDARILELREQLKLATKELKAAERKREARQDRRYARLPRRAASRSTHGRRRRTLNVTPPVIRHGRKRKKSGRSVSNEY